MDPTSVQTLNNLGYSLLLQGKPELDLTFFRDAARIAPDNTVIAANAEQAVTARIEARSQAVAAAPSEPAVPAERSEEPTSELPSLMRLSYAVFCLQTTIHPQNHCITALSILLI